MKKIVSLITMAAMLAVSTPAVANGRHQDNRWGVDSNRNSPYHNRHHRNKNRINTGEAVAIGIGALILGAAISNNNRNRRVEQYEYPQQRRQPQYVCQDVVQYDYYGNPYVAGRNCWYQ
jgi:Ni/Co efflux regulator RcnB